MTTIVLVWLLVAALGAFAAREGFNLGWLWTAVSGLIMAALAVAVTFCFRGSRAALTAFRDHLVDDLGTLWRRWSIWIQASIIPLATAWVAAPQEWRDAVPKWLLVVMMVVYSLATIGAQAIKQPNIPKDGG